jgi:hypothetical protein
MLLYPIYICRHEVKENMESKKSAANRQYQFLQRPLSTIAEEPLERTKLDA